MKKIKFYIILANAGFLTGKAKMDGYLTEYRGIKIVIHRPYQMLGGYMSTEYYSGRGIYAKISKSREEALFKARRVIDICGDQVANQAKNAYKINSDIDLAKELPES